VKTPVIFLVFNRPELTRQVLCRIRDAKPEKLIVVADGPRANRPDDRGKCNSVRSLFDTLVDWPCELVRDFSNDNLGCGRRVASGITNAFKHVEEAIIIEDDCLPDHTFFRFCEEMLERYRDEHQVAQIAGCSFQERIPFDGPSYFFSRYPHCWGWATWRRAWRMYDHEMAAWREGAAKGWLRHIVDDRAECKWWAFNFDATAAGHIDTWDFRWTLAVWRNQLLTVVPYRNLISNIGFGPDGTHTRDASPLAARSLKPMQFPLVHPSSLDRDIIADKHTSRTLFRFPSIARRLMERFRGHSL